MRDAVDQGFPLSLPDGILINGLPPEKANFTFKSGKITYKLTDYYNWIDLHQHCGSSMFCFAHLHIIACITAEMSHRKPDLMILSGV